MTTNRLVPMPTARRAKPVPAMVSKRPAADHPDPAYWQAIRAERLEIADHCCETCGTGGPLDCHHRSYARFGAEDVDDLRMLCRDCHESITMSVRRRRGDTVQGRALWVIGFIIVTMIMWFGRDVLPTWLSAGFWLGTALAVWTFLWRRHPWVAAFVLFFVAAMFGGGRRGRW